MLRKLLKGEKTTSCKNDKTVKEYSTTSKNVSQVPINQKTIDRSIRKTISPYFPTNHVPLEKPSIDKNFKNLSHIERVTESLRYNVHCLEYSISPKGGLRHWIKINIALLILFGIPVMIFMPLITYLIGGVAEISGLLANASQYLFEGALNILKLIGVVIAVILGLIILLRVLR